MEILQTIWTALITENETLTKVFASFLMFIELYISMLLFTTILNISANKKQKILYVLVLSLIGILNLWIIPTPYNTFVNLLACPILVYFIFKTNILKSILAEIIPYIAFIVLGPIVLSIILQLSNNSSNIVLLIPIYRIVYSLLLYTCVFLLKIILSNLNININMIDNMKKPNSLIILSNFIIGLLAITILSFVLGVYNDVLPFVVKVCSIFSLFIYFCISIYSLTRTIKLEITSETLEEERLYNKTLTILYDNIRGFKHDFNNIVQAIGGYISTNNMEGLKDYYSGLMEDCKKVNNLAVLNPELINNPAVYSLLTSKYHKAEELNIKMNFEIFLDLTTLNIKTYDLSRILGILLDNAIEASSKCEERIINITIRKDNKANRQLFIIENTYSNKDIDTDRIFEKGYTSKKGDNKSHGLGLWEVRKVLSKNNNLNLFTTKDNKFFKQQLEIYC